MQDNTYNHNRLIRWVGIDEKGNRGIRQSGNNVRELLRHKGNKYVRYSDSTSMQVVSNSDKE